MQLQWLLFTKNKNVILLYPKVYTLLKTAVSLWCEKIQTEKRYCLAVLYRNGL